MKNNICRIFFALFLISNVSFGQEEYFVQINPATCVYTIIDSIPGVIWVALDQSTFDKINNRYIFRGQDNSGNWFLYSIDASNGQIISNPQVPGNFAEITFDNSSEILYGLHWIGSLANKNFTSINPTNFNYTIISTINLTTFGNDAVIDEINHRLIFAADDSSGIHCLYSIDAITGNIVSKPQFPTPNIMGYLAFDNSSGNLYGLRLSSTPLASVFVSINPTNGNYTIIDTIPYDLSGGIPMGFTTFDEINRRYTFCAMDNNNNSYLYTIDATNGQVIYNPHFPPLITPYNLIEPKYDNSTGTLYALHWGPINTGGIEENTSNNDIVIYPNPVNNNLNIKASFKTELEILNTEGQIIKSIKVKNSYKSIDISDFSSGVYIIKAKTDKGIVIKKFIKQ